MNHLAKDLQIQSRTMKQVQRQGRVAIYEVFGPHGRPWGYEVIVIKIRPPEVAFGVAYPEREVYPGNEDWGMYGWAYQAWDLARAQRRFCSLLPKWGANVPKDESMRAPAPQRGRHA